MAIDTYLVKRIVNKAAQMAGDAWRVRTQDMDSVLRQAEALPKSIDFETTNICNANCVFCAYQYQKRATGFMDMELYRRLIGEVHDLRIPAVNFTPLVGDPLVDPHILERARLARERGIESVSFFTNGILFRKVGVQAILDSGLTDISLSTAGFDEESYLRIYRSKMYRQMFDGLVALLEENDRRGRPIKVFVHIRADEPLTAVRKKPDFLRIASLIDGVDANLRFDSWSGLITPDQLLGGMRVRAVPAKHHPCWMLYWGLTVLWDGTVTACGCRDLNASSDLVLGNARETTLSALWTGSRIGTIREAWIRAHQLPEICKDCSHYTPTTRFLRADMKAEIEASVRTARLLESP